MLVEREVVLPVPAEAAWSALVDWERQAEWMRDADRVEVVSGAREGVGATLAVRTKVLGVPLFTERLEVVEWAPPAVLTIAHRSFIHGTGEWRLRSVEGGTRFTWVENLSLPAGALGELALRAYRPILRRLMRGSMEALRRHLIEAGPSADRRRTGSG